MLYGINERTHGLNSEEHATDQAIATKERTDTIENASSYQVEVTL
jgi:hypothetical protein